MLWALGENTIQLPRATASGRTNGDAHLKSPAVLYESFVVCARIMDMYNISLDACLTNDQSNAVDIVSTPYRSRRGGLTLGCTCRTPHRSGTQLTKNSFSLTRASGNGGVLPQVCKSPKLQFVEIEVMTIGHRTPSCKMD